MINDLFRKLFGKNDSKNVAKNRLKLALIYDKLEVSEDVLSDLQRDLVEVISRYFVIDKQACTLDITQINDLSALVVNTPILSARHKSQIG